MNRSELLNATNMTPIERQLGRFMRAPDHPLSNDSGDTGNNTGNSGDSETDESGEDNTSQANELEQFWNEQADEAPDEESEREIQTASQNLGKQLGDSIKAFKGPEAFTKEIADAIADGDLGQVNAAFAARDQALLQQSMTLSAKLFGGVIERLTADFEARIERALGNKDSEVALETHFPLARDKAMRPMVKRVWDQALRNAKGNKEEAIRQTRGMLDAFGQRTSLREPPEDTTAGINTRASRSLVDDLLERK